MSAEGWLLAVIPEVRSAHGAAGVGRDYRIALILDVRRSDAIDRIELSNPIRAHMAELGIAARSAGWDCWLCQITSPRTPLSVSGLSRIRFSAAESCCRPSAEEVAALRLSHLNSRLAP